MTNKMRQKVTMTKCNDIPNSFSVRIGIQRQVWRTFDWIVPETDLCLDSKMGLILYMREKSNSLFPTRELNQFQLRRNNRNDELLSNRDPVYMQILVVITKNNAVQK